MNGNASLELISDLALIDYLSATLYRQFRPTASLAEFDVRLRDWLDNHPTDERRRTMLSLIPFLAFFGEDEFVALRQHALTGVIPQFLVESFGLDIMSTDLGISLSRSLSRTLFVGLTKSGGLYEFCKVNSISQEYYLYADLMSATGMTTSQREYMASFDALVLIEDFIGTGSQSASTVAFVCSSFASTPVLCAPMICCPTGYTSGAALRLSYPSLRFAPILSMAPGAFLKPDALEGEISIATEVRELIRTLSIEVPGYAEISVAPFGFEDTGALTVLYSNCPDNVIELVHLEDAAVWSSLFPRV
jgi:hypothetical protein